jgi:hypothetical protein
VTKNAIEKKIRKNSEDELKIGDNDNNDSKRGWAVTDGAEPMEEDPQDSQKSQFDILANLQRQSDSLKYMINQDLIKLGCSLQNVCIYSVIPNDKI